MKRESDHIHAYLRSLARRLWLFGPMDPEARAEIEDHLYESREEGLRQGLSSDAAEERAIERFGPVRVIASHIQQERRIQMQKVLLAVGIVLGLLLAYIDSRPTWDDSGILAGGLVVSAGLLTLLGFRRPWLAALAAGLWMPLYDIYRSHDFTMLIVLIFPLLGAYAGWAARLGIQKIFHPA